jgi:preprotein translocase subunit SecA
MLVGTISIEKSEHLSGLLSKKGIPHQVLNAKYHEREAEIVAQAGRLGAVTIATNMAGRGTDIVLGGNADFMAAQEIRRRETKDASDIPDAGEVEREALRKELVAEYRKQTEADGKSVIENGGLHIIGTERHESRRIDNQLRGRAGRQGDPGSSRFYISLEDDLMRLFGGDNIAVVMEKLGIEEDQPIEHGIITRAIENAQRRVESRNFEARKHVLEYDDVMNQQREVIYQQRRQILEGTNLKGQIWDMIAGCIQRGLDIFADPKIYPEEWDLAGLIEYLEGIYMPPKVMIQSELERYTREELQQLIYDRSLELYDYKEKDLGSDTMRELERVVMLRVVDSKWIDHLDGMDDLREGIGLRAYGQRDPLTEYKFEAYDAFQQMIESIQGDIVRNIFHVNIVKQPKERKFVDNRNDAGTVQPIVKKDKKVGRNDPCPCGSGKKYKKCCGKEG